MSARSEHEAPNSGERSRAKFELIHASVWLAVGFFVLPALIFLVGTLMLGTYADNAGLGTFYADFFADLVEPAGRVWILALAPLVLASVLRLVFWNFRQNNADEEPLPPPEPARRARERVEPRVSAE